MADIYNSNSNTLIVGTAGDDSIENSLDSTNVTINGAAGNDTIHNASDGNLAIISGDADNDLIDNKDASNVSISGGAGNDSIGNWYGGSVTIDGGEGDDSIYNGGESGTISSGEGNDWILQSGESVTVGGDAGNDTIYNQGDSVTIDGGDGNDTIVSSGSYSSVSGGSGDDYILGDGGVVHFTGIGITVDVNCTSFGQYGSGTINGGLGNDQIVMPIYSANNVIQYTEGDGNDTVWGYSASNSLQINSASPWSSVVSGNDIVITVGDGSITLVDAASLYGGGTDNITPDTLPPAVGGAAYDIVFFVDVSGSMETYINRVNTIAQTFVDKLKERGITDYRLAVVDYETAFNVYFGADGSPFTQDVDTFKSWMAQAAEKSKSNLANENALYAINHVLNNFPFNPTANKEFIVLTDENFTDDGYPENFGGNIFDLAATEQFMATNGVQLDVIGLPRATAQEKYSSDESRINCEPAWTPVARNTGGNFYDINGNYTETFNEIVLNLDCVNVNLATVPDGQTGWFFVVPGNHVTDLKSVDAIFVNAADPNLEAYTQLYGQPVGAVTADKVYSGTMSAYRQKITIPDTWNVTATSHADILNVAGTGFGVVIASGDGHDAVKLGEAATGIILTDHDLKNDGLEFARRQTLGTFTENVATDPVTMTNQVALTSPTMAVYLQNFSSPLQEEFDAKNEQFMAYGVTNGGTTNTVYDLLFGTEPTPEPPVEPVIPPQPPIANDTLEGRIMFAQWGYGFTPTKDNPLYGATTAATTDTTSAITTETLATSADLVENFGSPTLDEISPANFAVTQDDFTAQNFNALDTNVTQMILASNKFNV